VSLTLGVQEGHDGPQASVLALYQLTSESNINAINTLVNDILGRMFDIHCRKGKAIVLLYTCSEGHSDDFDLFRNLICFR
jgi:hypothetical protein